MGFKSSKCDCMMRRYVYRDGRYTNECTHPGKEIVHYPVWNWASGQRKADMKPILVCSYHLRSYKAGNMLSLRRSSLEARMSDLGDGIVDGIPKQKTTRRRTNTRV